MSFFFLSCCCLILCWSRLVLVPVFLFCLLLLRICPQKIAAAAGRCALLIGRSLLFPGKTDMPHGTKWVLCFFSTLGLFGSLSFVCDYYRFIICGLAGWSGGCLWFLSKILSCPLGWRFAQAKRKGRPFQGSCWWSWKGMTWMGWWYMDGTCLGWTGKEGMEGQVQGNRKERILVGVVWRLTFDACSFCSL